MQAVEKPRQDGGGVECRCYGITCMLIDVSCVVRVDSKKEYTIGLLRGMVECNCFVATLSHEDFAVLVLRLCRIPVMDQYVQAVQCNDTTCK